MPGTSYSRPYICKYNNRFLLFSRLACRSTTIYIILSIPRLHFELHRFLEILGMYFSFSSLFKNVLFFLYSTPLNKGSFSSSSGSLEACYPSGKLKYIYSHNSSKLHPLYHTYSAYFLTPGTFGLRSPLVLTICWNYISIHGKIPIWFQDLKTGNKRNQNGTASRQQMLHFFSFNFDFIFLYFLYFLLQTNPRWWADVRYYALWGEKTDLNSIEVAYHITIQIPN